MLVLVPQRANLYQLLQWHLRIRAKNSLHQVSPFQISQAPSFPLPDNAPGAGLLALAGPSCNLLLMELARGHQAQSVSGPEALIEFE